MAILGLTNRSAYDPNRAIPRLGKLRKGAPKPESGNRPGSDLDYFRVDFAPQYAYLQEAFEALYGTNPTEFTVKLVGKTVEDVFPTGYEARNATTLLHLCDGETQAQHWDANKSRYDRNPTPCEKGNNSDKFACGCKQIGRLNITLPELTDATGVMGKFVIETHSIFDIMKLFNQLMFLEEMFGGLMWLPAIVGRANEEKPYTKQDGSRGKKMYSLMYIKYYVPLLQSYMEPQLPEPDQGLLLPSGNDEDGDVMEEQPQLPPPENTDDNEDEQGSEEGLDLNTIATWMQKKLNTNITVTDIETALNEAEYLYDDQNTNANLDAVVCVLEYWCQDPETGELVIDDVQKAVDALFGDESNRQYVMGKVVG